MIVGALLFIFRGLDNAPKFQIPDDERVKTQSEIANDNTAKMSPWDYYTSLRHKSWNELSEHQKERMVLAAHIILDECGTLSTLSELEGFLKNHLPEVPDPWPGGDGVLGGFIEWQKNMKTIE